MRTRNHDWFDTKTLTTKYGFQVYHDGRWCHAHEDGEPCIYDTEAERDAERAKARKIAAAPELYDALCSVRDCETLRRENNDAGMSDELLAVVDAAIARAHQSMSQNGRSIRR